MAKLFESIGKLGLALAIGGGVVNSALFNGKFTAKLLCNVPNTTVAIVLSLYNYYLKAGVSLPGFKLYVKS